jgi:hypothetical protein
MEKKFLFFDIDGTLLTDDKVILDSTKEAIKKLHEQGHETAIATGRNAKMAKEIIDELGMKNYIVCNGAAGYFHEERAYFNPLDKAAFQRLLKVADANGHQVVYETAHEVKRRDQEAGIRMKEGMKFVGYEVPEYDREFHKENDLTQLLLFYNEEEKDLYENGQFPEFRFVRWYKDGVDVLPANGSKYETIIKVAESKGFKKEDIIAFGDGLNDYEMISNVGMGIAMGNAEEIVKEVAEMVTHTNNNHGISLALKELTLI